MTEKQLKKMKKWEVTREKGKRHYVFWRGFVLYGFSYAILFYLVNISLHYLFGLDSVFLDNWHTMFTLIIYTFIGIPSAWWRWNENEELFFEYQWNDNPADQSN